MAHLEGTLEIVTTQVKAIAKNPWAK